MQPCFEGYIIAKIPRGYFVVNNQQAQTGGSYAGSFDLGICFHGWTPLFKTGAKTVPNQEKAETTFNKALNWDK
jgi:hypothetical protein